MAQTRVTTICYRYFQVIITTLHTDSLLPQETRYNLLLNRFY